MFTIVIGLIALALELLGFVVTMVWGVSKIRTQTLLVEQSNRHLATTIAHLTDAVTTIDAKHNLHAERITKSETQIANLESWVGKVDHRLAELESKCRSGSR